MKTTDLVVCLSLIGVIAEPAHDFNICMMSEGKNGGKEAVTVQLQPIAMFYIVNRLKINVKPAMGNSVFESADHNVIISISNLPRRRHSPHHSINRTGNLLNFTLNNGILTGCL